MLKDINSKKWCRLSLEGKLWLNCAKSMELATVGRVLFSTLTDPVCATKALFSGNADEGRLLLRNYVHATIGFPELPRRTGKADKNLMRSLSEKGNPTASKLFEIIQVCMQEEGISLDPHIITNASSELIL